LDGLYSVAPFIAAVALASLSSRVDHAATRACQLRLWAAVTAAAYAIWIPTRGPQPWDLRP